MMAKPIRVLCVAGARPNFMKVKPAVDALEGLGAEVHLLHTGQHYDDNMSDVFFRDIGLRQPDRILKTGPGSQATQTAQIMIAFEPELLDIDPDVVVVVGDVNSTLAAALVAAKCGYPVAHIEAGLRSCNWSMPEEINRVLTDRLSGYLFAPSADAVVNLRAEGVDDSKIYLVGNLMIDTLLANLDRARGRSILGDLGLVPGHYGLVTLHRPAMIEDHETLAGVLGALEELGQSLPLVFPVHPRTRPRVEKCAPGPGLQLMDPVGYLDFLALEMSARLVLTDSGGVQEETTVLGVPCLTLRSETERPVTVVEGTNSIVGTDPTRILAAARECAPPYPPARAPAFWDGKAAERMARILVSGSRP